MTGRDPWDSQFGVEPAFSLGVEEELLVLGPDDQLAGEGAQLAQEADPEEGDVDRELFKAMVETRSEVSSSAEEAVGVLREIRRELINSGARIMGAGLHPTAGPGGAATTDAPRYALIANALQGVLRTPICGQHIHIGMPDEETAVRAYNGIRVHIPLINALAANSPFWFGEDSGLASSRTAIFRSYPRAAMAPAFEDFADFCRVTSQVCTAAGLDDYTHIWWDARLHPGLGTIEIRAADTQCSLWRAGAITALVHCLARLEAERAQEDIPVREALAESSFQATRHGLDAELLNRRCEAVPARDLARQRVEEAATVAGELGCESELQTVELILEEGCGADVQRRVYESRGMQGVLDHLIAESASLEPGMTVAPTSSPRR
jgi:carboxylate-amine ligase